MLGAELSRLTEMGNTKMMSNLTGYFALGAAVLTFATAAIGVVLSIRNGRRLTDNEEITSTKMAELAQMLVTQNTTMAAQKELAVQQLAKTNEASQTLATIHTLVNGNLLNAQRRELQATRASLESMREVVEMKQDAGIPVAPESLAAIELLETQCQALASEIRIKEMAIENFGQRVHAVAVEPIIDGAHSGSQEGRGKGRHGRPD